MSGTPAAVSNSAISSNGAMLPNTLETWLGIIKSAPCTSACFSAEIIAAPSHSGVSSTVGSIFRAVSDRMTALCS